LWQETKNLSAAMKISLHCFWLIFVLLTTTPLLALAHHQSSAGTA